MLLHILAILGGVALLLYGADRFVVGAAATARNFGLSPLLIGLTIVGFATSAPEILVSATAAYKGISDMAVGNALGSNIANIGLVLGAAALVKPILISDSGVLRREMPALVIITILASIAFFDHYLGRVDSILLLIAFVAFMIWIVKVSIGSDNESATDEMASEFDSEIPDDMATGKALFWLVLGLLILLAGSNMLVWGAEALARALGISELIIGLTIVAIGTSLPELAVTVMSAIRGEAGLAIGNIVGSNIYNLLAVVGIAGVINPTALDSDVLLLHFPVMFAFTIALYLIAYNGSSTGTARIRRRDGVILLLAFSGYQLNNFI